TRKQERDEEHAEQRGDGLHQAPRDESAHLTRRPALGAGRLLLSSAARAKRPRLLSLLEPPLFDIPVGLAVRVRIDVLQMLVREEQTVRRIEEGVRGVLVERLVDLLERQLPRGLAAVRSIAVVEERLIDGRIVVRDVVELTLALLARVPDGVRIRVRAE